jgi:hypothetical protein
LISTAFFMLIQNSPSSKCKPLELIKEFKNIKELDP